MTMTLDDLTQVKHIGPSRMKVLNANGIRTIKQLFDAPLEKLAQIESIGERYAKLIKDAVVEYYGEKPKQPPAKPTPVKEKKPETVVKEKKPEMVVKEKKIEMVDQNLGKQIKMLTKRLKRANENLKPLGKKKLLEPYVQFKKRSNTLKSRLKELDQLQGNLSKKLQKNISKKVDALNATLKNIGKKPKKKKYQSLSKKIQSFSKMLKETCL
jgi:nucleotidyltransferase/DNA polymerase involved in DNA repair